MERIVLLVDMDCFYVQVEQRLQPQYIGKPCAVVQYNPYKGGGIIAVGYEARAFGVKRNGMRGAEAQKICPDIHLFQVPEERGKANLTRYREACTEVIEVLIKFSQCVEKASVDEAYIDITEEVEKRMQEIDRVAPDQLPNTHIVGFKPSEEGKATNPRNDSVESWLSTIYEDDDMNIHDRRLAVGALFAEEIRLAVYNETGFRCSAGIGHNKTLAKLACGINKPNQQTVLPQMAVPDLFKTIPISKVRGFGGKLGKTLIETQGMKFMGDILSFSEKQLQASFGDKTGAWMYNVCRGIDHEPVTARQLSKSLGCGKNFNGRECLDTKKEVQRRLKDLSEELEERLIKEKEVNKRTAKSLTVCAGYMSNPTPKMTSRTCALVTYRAEKIASDAYSLLQKLNVAGPHSESWSPPIVNLAMSASKFEDDEKDAGNNKISSMFSKISKSDRLSLSNTQFKDNNISMSDGENSFQLSPQKGSIQSFFKKHDKEVTSGREESTSIKLNTTLHSNSCISLESTQSKKKSIMSFFKKQSDKCLKKAIGANDEIAHDFGDEKTLTDSVNCTSGEAILISDDTSNSVDSKYDSSDEAVRAKKGFFASKQQNNSPASRQGTEVVEDNDACKELFPTSVASSSEHNNIKEEVSLQSSCTSSVEGKSKKVPSDCSSLKDKSKITKLSKNRPRYTVEPISDIDFKTLYSFPESMQKEILPKLSQSRQEAYNAYKCKKIEKFNKEMENFNGFEGRIYEDSSSSTSTNSDSESDFYDIPELRVETMKCHKCGKVIAVEDQIQHSDYHFALEIQKQGMYRTVDHFKQTNNSLQRSDPHSNSIQRKGGGPSKRKSTSQITGSNKKNKLNEERTLHSFFSQKNS